MADPLKSIILRIMMALISAIVIIEFFKPLTNIAVNFMVCDSCDSLTATFLITLTFMGTIGIVMYKFFGIFYHPAEG